MEKETVILTCSSLERYVKRAQGEDAYQLSDYSH